jgi:hypothetical protein
MDESNEILSQGFKENREKTLIKQAKYIAALKQ